MLATLAVLAAFAGLVQTARTPTMAMLYSGLDPAAAGEVAAAVEGLGVTVQINGNAILVPANERDRLRLTLAAQGLPKAGPAGFEILDGMDGFGTTSEMFEATYWRAKEGELARTVLATPGVASARVHIANPVGRPFQRATQPSASVTVSMSGGALQTGQAEAIRFLVASAVAGLDPQRVSVIDAARGAVLRLGEDAGAGGAMQGQAREAALRGEVERLLAARVGEGRAIVTVSVDSSTDSETIVERRIDPDSRIAISSETRETQSSNSGGAAAGAATVASNLPQNAGGGGGGAGAQSNRSETEERVNFEVSETRREVHRHAGEVRRLTVAVLVDGVVTTGADGARNWIPRPPEELDQLRDLVRAAVGFNEQRGDVVTVETLEFAPRPESGTVAQSGAMDFVAANGVTLIQTGVLAAVAMGLIFFVLSPLIKAGRERAQAERAADPFDGAIEGTPMGFEGDPALEEAPDKITMLRDLFQEQREDSANVLRGWLEHDLDRDEDGAGVSG